MVTRKIINDLFDYLTQGDYFSETSDPSDNEEMNRTVNNDWRNKIGDGLAIDFKRILKNEIVVTQKNSRLNIEDNDAQGATIWKSFVTLTDKNESMDVVINFVVNHNNAFIYLGTRHSHLDSYSGTSKTLSGLFRKLKSNEQVGHFFQTKFYDLES